MMLHLLNAVIVLVVFIYLFIVFMYVQDLVITSTGEAWRMARRRLMQGAHLIQFIMALNHYIPIIFSSSIINRG